MVQLRARRIRIDTLTLLHVPAALRTETVRSARTSSAWGTIAAVPATNKTTGLPPGGGGPVLAGAGGGVAFLARTWFHATPLAAIKSSRLRQGDSPAAVSPVRLNKVPFMLRWGAHRVRSRMGLVDRLHVMLNFFVWLAVSRLIVFLLCCLDCPCRKKIPRGKGVYRGRPAHSAGPTLPKTIQYHDLPKRKGNAL